MMAAKALTHGIYSKLGGAGWFYRRRVLRLSSFLHCQLLLLGLLLCPEATAGLPPRTNHSSVNLPAQMPIVGFGFTNAFANLTFENPVGIVSPPGDTNRVFVVEKTGRIFVITNLASPTKTLFLDDTADLFTAVESGLLGLAFHPGYSSNGWFFIYHTIGMSVDGFPRAVYDELARFTADPADPNRAQPESKLRLFAQVDASDQHNGGDLKFGPDGYLYVSIGEDTREGGALPAEPQTLEQNLFGVILRLDVDQRPGNLLPNPSHGGTTNYYIPADNPFVGVAEYAGKTLNPGKVRTEIYALGFRNGWQMTFNGDELLVADVGSGLYEEVNVVRPGANYGWPYNEGNLALLPTPPNAPPFTSALYFYGRGGKVTDGHCIIGGPIYRGARLPRLQGAYLFGDFVNGRVWAMHRSGSNDVSIESLANAPQITCFGTDPANGDILAATYDGRLLRLIHVEPTETSFPVTLADTGVFADLASLTIQPEFVPYEVSVPLWSDGAKKARWFTIPNATDTIGFSASNLWRFPSGAVWVKHFELELTNGVPESRHRLETRFLVTTTTGAYGMTYRWGNSLTNATLVEEGGRTEDFVVNDGNGLVRTQTWIYPTRADCLRCHNAGAGYVLGFTTPQMNCPTMVDGVSTNQIQLLASAGYLSESGTNQAEWPAITRQADAPLEFRFRSYVDANCSYCHNPASITGPQWDARITTPISLAKITNSPALTGLPGQFIIAAGSPQNSMLYQRIANHYRRMPYVGSLEFDPYFTNLVHEYARTLPAAPWLQRDVGRLGREGSASLSEGHVTIAGSGKGMGGDEDAFHFLFQPLRGNAQILAKLAAAGPAESQAGPMIRADESAGSAFLALCPTTDGGWRTLGRSAASQPAWTNSLVMPSGTAWARLVRDGEEIHAFGSTNGTVWFDLGQWELDLPEIALLGLACSSTSNSTLATARFEEVALQSVRLLAPVSGMIFQAPESILLRAELSGSGPTPAGVEFYDGPDKIGECLSAPYEFLWTNALSGPHLITAMVRTGSEAAVFSEPGEIDVLLPSTRLGSTTRDETSRGNWIGLYGAAAAVIPNLLTNLPEEFALSIDSSGSVIWAQNTTAQRALRKPNSTSRFAGAWLSTSNLTFDLEIRDGRLHQLALYFLNWELNVSRQQRVEIFSLEDFSLLHQTVISNFATGIYLTYPLRGAVRVKISRITGPNVVLSGLFLDDYIPSPASLVLTSPNPEAVITVPETVQLAATILESDQPIERVEFYANGSNYLGQSESPPFGLSWQPTNAGSFALTARATDVLGETHLSPPIAVTVALPSAMAELLRVDTTTRGDWIGRYGSEGFGIPGYRTNYPAYARVQLGSLWEYVVWSTGDLGELVQLESTNRMASAWPQHYDTHFWFNDGQIHTLALYFLDLQKSRSMNLQIFDGESGALLFTNDLPYYGDGRFYVWKVRGHLRLHTTTTFGPDSLLSGIFFDARPDERQAQFRVSPVAQIQDGLLKFTIEQAKIATNSYTVELSEDLQNWQPAGTAVTFGPLLDLGDKWLIPAELPVLTGAEGRRFLRLRID